MASFLVVFWAVLERLSGFQLEYCNISRFCSCGTAYKYLDLGGISMTAEVVPMKLEQFLPCENRERQL